MSKKDNKDTPSTINIEKNSEKPTKSSVLSPKKIVGKKDTIPVVVVNGVYFPS